MMVYRNIALCLVLLVSPLDWAPSAVAASPPPSIADVVKPLMPAVVNLDVLKTTQPVAPASGNSLAVAAGEHFFGSGFVIDYDGYIVTNRHVVMGAERVTVRFADDTTLPAQVVSMNARPDLALLKVNPTHALATVHFATATRSRWVRRSSRPVIQLG